MNYKLILILLLALASRCSLVTGQNIYLFHSYEDTLKSLGKIIISGEEDAIKYKANEKFINTLKRALIQEKSFNYSFDSLITISKLISPDNTFKLFTWTILRKNGSYKYYGIIQLNNSKQSQNIIPLTDKSDSLDKPDKLILSDKNWFGAVYYKIIYNKYKRKQYYTLLGWQGNNQMSRKKLIEVLTFDSKNAPVFGGNYFKTQNAEPYRVIFEYSSEAVMALKYEEQYYKKKKGQSIYAYDKINNFTKAKSKNSNFKKKKAIMIVFDRLIPLNQGLEGQYQFYIPALDYVDAFIFRKGMWRMILDIDARNTKESERKHNEKYHIKTNPPQKK
jgi:hypothetical protein